MPLLGLKSTTLARPHPSMVTLIRPYRQRRSLMTGFIRPIVALIAGVNEAHGHVMGHAGAFTIPGEPDARTKIQALQDVGVTTVNHPSKFGNELKRRLSDQNQSSGRFASPSSSGRPNSALGASQRRNMHTVNRRPKQSPPAFTANQRRNIYLSEGKSFDLLRQQGVSASPTSGGRARRLLAVGIDRSTRSPCIIASPVAETTSPEGPTLTAEARRFPISFVTGISADGQLAVDRIASHLRLGRAQQTLDSLRSLVGALTDIFYEQEAFYLETHVAERLGALEVVGARFGLDDASSARAGPSGETSATECATEPATAAETPASASTAAAVSAAEAKAEAAKHGIVYIRLPGEETNMIGTIVNGAGLAMNTVDALTDAGGAVANFLDTGGKATSETVGKSFEAVLADPRVRVVFVNIFGGLTLGDMIARGVILAFRQLGPAVPVVVRIRGTNEEEGRRIVAESGLPLFAFDDFEEAAAKAIELSRASKV